MRVLGAVVTAAVAMVVGSVPASAAFPGKNGKIAFETTRHGSSNQEIYVVNPDGSGETRLTNNTAGDNWPAWSPDGHKIAFMSNRDGNSEIYVMNADGSGQTNITQNPAGDREPAWSPDGRIVFVTYRDGNSEIYVMNADGSGQTRVTNTPSSEGEPAWSPDGSKIAFIGTGPSGFSDSVYVMSADGTDTRLLYEGSASGCVSNWYADLDWSPDSSQLAATEFWEFPIDDECSDYNVYYEFFTSSSQGYVYAADPAWSPDGTLLANIQGSYDAELWTVDYPNLTKGTLLVDSSGYEYNPDWQPLPGPQRSDFKNAAQFCKAEREFLGEEAVKTKYATNGSGSNAFGKCVSQNATKP